MSDFMKEMFQDPVARILAALAATSILYALLDRAGVGGIFDFIGIVVVFLVIKHQVNKYAQITNKENENA